MQAMTSTKEASLTQLYFDNAAVDWDSKERLDAQQIEAILTLAGLRPGDAVLDVGCGTGVLFPYLLRRQPGRLRAIDLSPAMVRMAREKFAGTPAEVSVRDFYTFGEGGFDAVIVYNAYPHMLDKVAFAQSAARCLKPGGRLVVAHGAGRNAINRCHRHKGAGPISTPLLGCGEEASRLGTAFAFDCMVDTPHLYVLSGTLKP